MQAGDFDPGRGGHYRVVGRREQSRRPKRHGLRNWRIAGPCNRRSAPHRDFDVAGAAQRDFQQRATLVSSAFKPGKHRARQAVTGGHNGIVIGAGVRARGPSHASASADRLRRPRELQQRFGRSAPRAAFELQGVEVLADGKARGRYFRRSRRGEKY